MNLTLRAAIAGATTGSLIVVASLVTASSDSGRASAVPTAEAAVAMPPRSMSAADTAVLTRFAEPVSTSPFLATFDGAPDRPMPFVSPDWHVHTNVSDFNMWDAPAAMDAQHNHDCGAPPETHTVAAWDDAVFICRDHLMTTALSGDSYAATYLMPDHMLDFTTGPASLSFDVSTLVMSRRDWIDVWVTPIDDLLALPGESWFPAYQGEPRNAITVRKDGPTWHVTLVRDFIPSEVGVFTQPNSLVPSAKDRTTFVLTISKSSISFGTPLLGAVSTWDVGPLSYSRGVVQFGHHSYSPTKDESGAHATWHWDNVSIAPAASMVLGRVSPQRAIGDVDTVQTLEFASVVPPDAKLAFGAVCKIELNWGDGWILASPQPSALSERRAETASSYLVDATEGAGSVQVRFRSDDWWNGFPCMVEGAVLVSTGG